MDPILINALKDTIKGYDQLYKEHALPEPVPTNMKTEAMSIIRARMEALVAKDEKGSAAYKECAYLFGALKNGWTVGDITFLSKLYDVIKNNPNYKEKTEGMELLGQIRSVSADTLEKRFQMLEAINHYFVENSCRYVNASVKNIFKTEKTYERRVYRSEYPNDTHYDDFAQTVKGEEIAKFKYILSKENENKAYEERKIIDRREKSTFIRKEITPQQRLLERSAGFVPNAGQLHNSIVISNREVISRVFGDDVYDEIDEMSIGSTEERTVPIFHSMGTKWARDGHEVLEMEFAGSGGKQMPAMHKNLDGEVNTANMTPEQIKEKYGEQVKKSEDKYFDYLFKKDKTITAKNGEKIQKIKYNFAGANPDGIVSGLFNMGDYSIESCRANAQRFAKEFLEPHFLKWINGNEVPHDLMIMTYGHSRGAVSAGQAIKYIDKWITKFIESHPQANNIDFKHFVHYDYRSADAVPGAITNIRLNSCNLRNIPNVEATAFCSMGIQVYDFLFPLQHIKGCKRIVLTNTDHFVDTFDIDDSQVNIAGDRGKHADAYFDAETGEMYRRSGINQMPAGVYISDEKKNLVRVTSYSQLCKLYKTYLGNETPQYTRHRNIHYMVRDWFLENDLEMSFPDNKTRGEATEKNLSTEERILNSPNKRLRPIQREIRELIRLRGEDATKEELVAQQEKIIKVCRYYMEKTSIPTKEGSDSEYRMNLVSDLLSFNMRERNQLKKEISIEKGENRRFDLDERIEKYHDHLNKKEGYFERKQENEKKRLLKEKDLVRNIEEIAKKCDTELKKIKDTNYLKGNSESYVDYHNALVEGKKLKSTSTANEVINFLKKLTKLSDEYVYKHDTYIGPIFDDGKERLKSAKNMATYSKQMGQEVEENAKYYGDKDVPINKRIEDRNASIASLDAKIDAFEKAPKVAQAPVL